jgi:hypothetical protein
MREIDAAARFHNRRVREIVGWSGVLLVQPDAHKSTNRRSANNESANRQAVPRFAAMPSRYPISTSAKAI